MKQAFPCVLVLLTGMLAGCEVSTGPSAVPAAPISQAPQPAADSVVSDQPVQSAVPQLARGHLQFVNGYVQGLQRVQADHKPMLVFFTAEWCHFCHQMADDAFSSPQVVSLAQQFVCVLVDADAEPEACKQFRVQAFPTVQFVSARGIPLNRIVGKKPGHQLVMAMQAALQSVARRTTSPDNDRQF